MERGFLEPREQDGGQRSRRKFRYHPDKIMRRGVELVKHFQDQFNVCVRLSKPQAVKLVLRFMPVGQIPLHLRPELIRLLASGFHL